MDATSQMSCSLVSLKDWKSRTTVHSLLSQAVKVPVKLDRMGTLDVESIEPHPKEREETRSKVHWVSSPSGGKKRYSNIDGVPEAWGAVEKGVGQNQMLSTVVVH